MFDEASSGGMHSLCRTGIIFIPSFSPSSPLSPLSSLLPSQLSLKQDDVVEDVESSVQRVESR